MFLLIYAPRLLVCYLGIIHCLIMDDAEDVRECRICQSDDPRELIHPCQCRGSMRYVHRNCLNQWRAMNANRAYFNCDVCGYQYRMSRLWWGKVLMHPATRGALAVGFLASFGYLSGQVSSAGTNAVYYWFHHQDYHSPHRLQVLFHGLFWVSLPGLWIMAKRAWNALQHVDIGEPPRARRRPWWYTDYPIVYHVHSAPPPAPRQQPQENKEEEKKEKEKPKVADCPQYSTMAWLTVIGGTLSSLYETYQYVSEKVTTYCSNMQEFIENV